MGKNLNRQVFYEDEYEALDNYGLKKGKVARIVLDARKQVRKNNAPAEAVKLDDLSRKELLAKAMQLGIPTNAKMGKRELINAIKNFV